jgi:hypothetical protein
MLTSLSESVIDMLCSRPPSPQVLAVGLCLCRGKELHQKKTPVKVEGRFSGGVVDAGCLGAGKLPRVNHGGVQAGFSTIL